MQRKGLLCIALVTLFIVSCSAIAYAEPGGYTVSFGAPDAPLYDSGSTEAVSFWELPLWIKMYYVAELLGALVTTMAAFKLAPFVFLKLKDRLENGNRESIYRHIDDNPGCTVSDISRGQSMNVGSVRYHVDRLEVARRIVRIKIGKFMRLFRNSGAYTDREIAVIAALHVRTSRSIMFLLMAHPGLTNKQIAERLMIKESMAHQYLAGLLQDGIVGYEKNGQQKMYYLKEDVDGIVQKLLEGRKDLSVFRYDAVKG